MPCNCGRNKNGGGAATLAEHEITLAVDKWGPILWHYLHCLAEKIGQSGNTIVDTDQANYMETLLTMLPLVLPCKECQAHAATYINTNAIPTLRGLYGQQLRSTVREWLFLFHNAVRQNNQQPILVETVNDCQTLYIDCGVYKADYNFLVQSVAAAIRQGWVRIEHWRKWYSNSERLRILTGNVIV